MTAAVVENMEHKKARAEEANLLLEGLDDIKRLLCYFVQPFKKLTYFLKGWTI